jgi:hypothetical protein
MNKLLLFLIFKITFGKIFIRNIGLPICVNCIHFIEFKNNYPYDSLPDDSIDGRCKKFGEINSITGIIEYDFAIHCRTDEKKCGKNGSEYKEK